MVRVLIAEPNYSKKAKEILSSFAQVSEGPFRQEEAMGVIDRFDVLVIRLNITVDKKMIDKARRLKIIGTSTTGLDHIDMGYAKEKNIRVLSLKGETDFLQDVWATAEHTFALILSLIRKVPSSFDAVKFGKWDKSMFQGNELRGKTLGIVGFGRLGHMVAEIAKGFGMKVVASDPYVPKSKMRKKGVLPVPLSRLLKQSDVVSLHVDLNAKSAGLIGKEEFHRMKPSAFLINTSRGQIIDEKALLSALRNKAIKGAAIDVMKSEEASGKFLRYNPLLTYAKNHDNLIVTPHIAGTTEESLEKTQVFIAQKIIQNIRSLV